MIVLLRKWWWRQVTDLTWPLHRHLWHSLSLDSFPWAPTHSEASVVAVVFNIYSVPPGPQDNGVSLPMRSPVHCSVSEALVSLFSWKPLHTHHTFKGWMEGTVLKYHIGAQHGDLPLIPVFTLKARAGGVWGQPALHNEFQDSQIIWWLKHNLKFVNFSFGTHCADQANLEYLAILLPLLPGIGMHQCVQ